MSQWPPVKLGDVLVEQKQRIGTFNAGNLPLLGVSNSKGLHRSSMPRISDMSRYLRVERNWFAYNPMRINVGSIGLAETEEQTGVISPDYVVFSCSDRVDPRLLFSFLKDRRGLRAINSATAGTVRARLYFDSLAQIEFPLPPLDEQARLVERLSEFGARIQEIRTLRREIDTELDQLLLSAFMRIADGAPSRSMSEVAPIVRRPVTVAAAGSYPELGVRSFGKGTFHKPALSGVELGGKRIFYIYSDDLVFSNVFAWEGAIAVATSDDTERVGSHRFITCVPQPDRATSQFLCFYFLTRGGMEKIRAASPGGAGRNRTLGLTALQAIEVPTPPIADQQWFDLLQRKVEVLRKNYAETLSEIDEFMPSVIDSAFKGELLLRKPSAFALAPRQFGHDCLSRRSAVACYIVDKLHHSPTFGRTQLMKGLYMAEAFAGIDLGGEYERQAAGPFDKLIYEMEGNARQQSWFGVNQGRTGRGHKKFSYRPLKEMQGKVKEAIGILGATREKFDSMLALFAHCKTQEVEMIATLYAAWNDLMLAKHRVSDEIVVREVRENWHEAKRQIPEERWRKQLEWMRQKGITPNGVGRMTHRSR